MNPQPQSHRRRIKLIKPRLQLKMVGVFVGLSALGFLLQSLHVGLRLSELSASMPEGGSYLMAVMPELPLEILLVSFGMLLPLTIAVGILVTFRIAGPVYRFEKFLKAVLRGEEVGSCRIRKGDEFQELCELINQATAAAREQRSKELAKVDATPAQEQPQELRKAG
ncbi:MAG: hypothetical protein ABL998_02750 [Planctomycetota bacterium]